VMPGFIDEVRQKMSTAVHTAEDYAAALDQARTAFDASHSLEARGELVDTLIAVLASQLSDVDEAKATLREIEAHLEHGDRQGQTWQARAATVIQFRIALAQSTGSHEEAIEIIGELLAQMPANSGAADLARLQALDLRIRSYLALERTEEAKADLSKARGILGPLAQAVPPQLSAMLGAMLLRHGGSIALVEGRFAEADGSLSEGLAIVRRLADPKLNGLRAQLAAALSQSLRQQGNDAEADAVLARAAKESEDAAHAPGVAHHHDHHHHHSHDHDHKHHHHHHHDHDHDCDCGAH
jgi:tetratricopeptide (TPR) repeat protein